ncbi:hypothetical protein HID58_043439, partial [Brassica napus]
MRMVSVTTSFHEGGNTYTCLDHSASCRTHSSKLSLARLILTPGESPDSERVNETNAGRKSLPEDKGPDVPADA